MLSNVRLVPSDDEDLYSGFGNEEVAPALQTDDLEFDEGFQVFCAIITTMTHVKDQLAKIINKRSLSCTDLHSIDQLSVEDCQLIFDVADMMAKLGTQKLDLMKGVSIANVFFESSNRHKERINNSNSVLLKTQDSL